jgi:hypothetical protein
MQLLFIRTILSSLTLSSLGFCSTLSRVRESSLNLPNSLCAFNLDSSDDHVINGQCATGFAVVSSKFSLDVCLANINGQLRVSVYT